MLDSENLLELYALTYEDSIWYPEIIYGVFTQPKLAEWALVDLIQNNSDVISDNEERVKIRHVKNGYPQTEWEIVKNYNDDDTYNELQEYF